jgi:hypothetical protein
MAATTKLRLGSGLPDAGVYTKIAHDRFVFRMMRCEGSDHGAAYEAGVGPSSIIGLGDNMQKNAGKKKEKCKNCEGKGTLKKGDKVVRCQRCDGTGIKR